MTVPFDYPPTERVRKHGPLGYSDPSGFRPWLRDDFDFRCVYCLRRERWDTGSAVFAIDHFVPISIRPDLALDYENLLYSCATCNLRKGNRSIPDPMSTMISVNIAVHANGEIHAESRTAEIIVRALQLDSPEMTEFRATWIRVFRLAARFDPALLASLVAPPDDLPDLAALRPPGGNSRPDGAARSHFARRVRP